MARRLIATVAIVLVLAAIPLRAATGPDAGTDSQNTVIWTNDELEKIRNFRQLSVVGRINEEGPTQASLPRANTNLEEAEWYSAQAARLQGELERRRAELRSYQQAIEDARSLRKTTGGINLEKGHVGLSPDSAMELLRERVNRAQARLDALQDLARHNNVSPGTLRDQ